MSLRPLLDIALDDERFLALAAPARDGGAAAGEAPSRVRISSQLRPYLLAALAEAEEGFGGRPVLVVAADDIGARDLARELRAYLERRVRYYPSRGTGYASHLTPPPHLVGLRVAALDALAASEPAVVVASAVALAEAVPDASLRPEGLTLARGTEVDLADVGDLLVEAGYERADQVEERGQFAIRGGILDVFPATEERAARVELFGDEIEQIRWFSTFTQRSLGDVDEVELSPAAELSAEHRELAELALAEQQPRAAADEDGAPSAELDVSELLPIDSYERGARADPRRDRDRRLRGRRGGASRPLGRRDDDDARRRRAPPLRRRRRAARRARRDLDLHRRLRPGALVSLLGAELGGAEPLRGGGPARAGARVPATGWWSRSSIAATPSGPATT